MSTDTMYINSSRMLPTRSKNKTSNAMFPRSNSSTSIKNNNNNNNNNKQNGNNNSTNRNKKHSHKSNANKNLDKLKVPLPQTLPNGEKPNFGGGSNSTTIPNNSKRNGNHSNNKDKSTKTITKNLKNLLLDNNNNHNQKTSTKRRSNSKSPKMQNNVTTNSIPVMNTNHSHSNSINPQEFTKQNTTPIMTFLTSPINGPGSIPNMNLSDQHPASNQPSTSSSRGDTPTPGNMPRVGSQILTRPGISMAMLNNDQGNNKQQNILPQSQQQQQQQYPQGFLQQPQSLQFQPQIQAQFPQQPQYGLPIGPGIQPNQSMPLPPPNIQSSLSQHFQGLGYPFALHNNYRLSSSGSPVPQQIQLMAPMFNQQNMHPMNNNDNAVRQGQATIGNTISPNVTPTTLRSTQITPRVKTSKTQQSSAKRNKARTSSHSFAGASFATDVPQESNLPKPSFL
ncbi:similar to Kazachstania africana KAFR_0J02690 hypothetical protein [Maudiozyma saulgeensis]|uniref:Enhancer of mRNA-decapping protein 1 n=1 Tax=Maudiozyma saulgeensis TaxID=1789683 RepID=A0A1X7QXJ8_9SACH|nr:similar to Kazachstania africana KAFR_0J02690 hypothetical protein [Kazachstania saulgeensis]